MNRAALCVVLSLAGCPKAPTDPAAGQPLATDDSSTLPGFRRLELPGNYKELRPLASAALPNGSVALAGGALRVVQYQWVARIPPTGEAIQSTLDPGRVTRVQDNGTAGLDAVGVLGGVPEDKAWYGDIDAFMNLGTKQTYLSDGSGQLEGVVRLADGLAAVGEMLDSEQRLHGWVVRMDSTGRDLWKVQLGDAPAQGLSWVTNSGPGLVAAGWQLGDTDDPWIVTTDAEGTHELDHRWEEPGWTRLSSGRVLPDGDLMVAGMSAPTIDGTLDGNGSLWVARIGADGTPRWDRQERSDLSVLTRATPWGRGLAIAGLRGPFGTERQVVVGAISDDGQTRWVEPSLPPGIEFAEVHSVDDELILVVALSDEYGLQWKRIALEGSKAP